MRQFNQLNVRKPGPRTWTAVLIVALFAYAAPAALSSEKSDALTKEAIALRRAGRDAEAVRKLQQAYDLEPTPKAAAQLGLCLQALGRWSEADGKLAEAISATTDPWIRKNRTTLKDSLEVVKTHVGRVEVLGEPVGATVTVNGKNVGSLPLADAVPVNEGLVDVELSAVGFERRQERLTMAGGSYQRLVVRLAKSPVVTKDLTKVPEPPSDVPQDSVATDGITARPEEAPPSTGKPILQNPWFWGGVVAVVAAGVVTAVLLSGGDPKEPGFTDSGDLR